MTPLRLTDLASDGGALLRRFGVMAYLEFLAIGIGTSTLHVLIAPGDFRAGIAAGGGSVLAVLTDPFIVIHEALFALVFGAACLRIWWQTEGGAPEPGARARFLAAQALPLVVLNMLAGYAAYMGVLLLLLPGLVISALTTTLVPAVVLEQRGWNGLARSFEMTRRHLWPLTAAWAAIILPWLVLSVWAAPGADVARADIGTLWLAGLVPDAFAAGLSTVSLCLVMATYRRLIADESGGLHDRLDDIIR